MQCQSLFSGKDKKKKIKMPSAENFIQHARYLRKTKTKRRYVLHAVQYLDRQTDIDSQGSS